MAEISANYASPNIRWAILLEDHPGATWDWRIVKGTDLGIPADWGGAGEMCEVTIRIPGHESVSAFKSVAEVIEVEDWTGSGQNRKKQKVVKEQTPELLNVLITKTLGRACKKAGYPDSMAELKSLILWRQRRAEVAMIGGYASLDTGTGPERLALPKPGDDADLDDAAVGDPEAPGVDDAPEGVDPHTGEILDLESTEAEADEQEPEDSSLSQEPPGEETMKVVRAVVTESSKLKTQPALRAWCKNLGIDMVAPATEAQATLVINRAAELAHEAGGS